MTEPSKTADEIMRLADEYAYAYSLVPNAARAALRAAVEQMCRERDDVREELARRDAIYRSGTVVVPNDEYSRLVQRAEQTERDNTALREENDRLREAVERGEDWSRRQMIRAEIAEDKLGVCASCGAAPEDQVISYIPVDQSETIDALRNDNAALREVLKECATAIGAWGDDSTNELLAKIDALP